MGGRASLQGQKAKGKKKAEAEAEVRVSPVLSLLSPQSSSFFFFFFLSRFTLHTYRFADDHDVTALCALLWRLLWTIPVALQGQIRAGHRWMDELSRVDSMYDARCVHRAHFPADGML